MRNRRKTFLTLFLAIVCLIFMFGNLASQESAAEYFEKAFYYEDVQGDLQKAIELYGQILKQFPKNREIAAKAQLHIGICYEKLGLKQAQEAFQRVITEYADQHEVVKDARKRLALLVPVSKGPRTATPAFKSAGITFKRIDIDEIEKTHQAVLSPDGTKILYIHVQDKKPQYSIRVMDLSSAQSKTLVEGIDWGHFIIFEWSPNGKKVVYRNQKKGLSVIDSDGGRPEVIWSNLNKDTAICPLDWSFDNRHILALIINLADATLRFVTLPAKGGESHTIVSGEEKELGESARFSPNGEYIVGFKTKESNTDVYLWPVEGGQEIRVTDHPAEDQYPFWSPDGKYIVFVSDRTKTKDLWAIPMKGPNRAGAPIRIKRNLGKNTMVTDLTPGGKLTMEVYASGGIPPDLFVLPVDPATGEGLGQFHPFAKYPTQHSMPRMATPLGSM